MPSMLVFINFPLYSTYWWFEWFLLGWSAMGKRQIQMGGRIRYSAYTVHNPMNFIPVTMAILVYSYFTYYLYNRKIYMCIIVQSVITNWVRISGPGPGSPGTCVAQVGGLDRGQAYRWVPFDCNDARPFICTHTGIINKIDHCFIIFRRMKYSHVLIECRQIFIWFVEIKFLLILID